MLSISPSYNSDSPDKDYHYGRGQSAGGHIHGIRFAIAFVAVIGGILKLACFASWYSRRQRVLVVRRLLKCEAVPIVNEDELQREDERAMEPDRPPPAYSPLPFEDNTEEAPTGPPPVYSRNPPSNESENTNTRETDSCVR